MILHDLERGPAERDVERVVEAQYRVLHLVIVLKQRTRRPSISCNSSTRIGRPCVRKRSYDFSEPKYSAISTARSFLFSAGIPASSWWSMYRSSQPATTSWERLIC